MAKNQLQNLVNDVEKNGKNSNGSSCVSNTTPIATTPNTITLTGTLRDFRGYRDTKGKINSNGHPDFERTPNTDKNPINNQSFKYGLDPGITTDTLGKDQKPIYAGGSFSTTTKENFDQWYRDVSGVNQSKSYPIVLTKKPNTKIYSFDNNGQEFFPLDGQLMGNEGRNHNFHFTYELNTRFTYQGGETFKFSGDDDVWVYINGKKVIDIGGVHSKTDTSVTLDSLGLVPGKTYDLNFFFAERHTTQSNFKIETTLELETAPDPNADDDQDGIPNILEGSETQLDSDQDGTPDYLDKDSDNNGIEDKIEVGIPASPSDSDNDKIPNFQDSDDDNNGKLDQDEIGSDVKNPINTDGVDLPDYQDLDDDNDGIVDVVDGLGDSDNDGTPNYHDNDSDGDGILDSVEGTEDADDDQIPNFLDPDSDGDGILDLQENKADSNNNDQSDIDQSKLPKDATIQDVDGDQIDNYLDLDSDNDGIKDKDDPNPYVVNHSD